MSAVQKAADELQQLLSSNGAAPEQIQAKLATLRQLREALKQELAQARAQLQQVLTVKQEATLVVTGILE
jgi:Spy/CpxP family protein refolding chaperone